MTEPKQKHLGKMTSKGSTPAEGIAPLLGALRQLIADSRQQVLRAVDTVQVQTYWHVGRHIVEFEQGAAQRAAYGLRLLPHLGQDLSAEFGRGLMPPICGTCVGFIWLSQFATHCVAN